MTNMTKEQFEQWMLDKCNAVATIIAEREPQIPREQAWETAKKIVFKGMEAITA